MDASGFIRIVSNGMGPVQNITLYRPGMAGPGVTLPASVQVNAVTEVIGDVQQTADRLMFSNRELKAAGWGGEPKHGDTVVYANGRTTVVQGRAEVHQFEQDLVYAIKCLGG
jgi:hypothetical protein